MLGEVATWRRLWECAKPTIAQVHGHYVTGGLMIAMECDLVVAAEDALFGQPEARAIGLAPDHGLWPLTAGIRQTKELLDTARLVTGTEAARMDMIIRAVPAADLDATVADLAAEIASDDDFLDGQGGADLLNGGQGIDTCLNGETLLGCELP